MSPFKENETWQCKKKSTDQLDAKANNRPAIKERGEEPTSAAAAAGSGAGGDTGRQRAATEGIVIEPRIKQALAGIRAGGPARACFLAFGISPDDPSVYAVARETERAYAECLVRLSLEAARASPVDWFKYIYETAHEDAKQYYGHFGEVNALRSPPMLKLLTSVAEWARANCTTQQCQNLKNIICADLELAQDHEAAITKSPEHVSEFLLL